MPVVAVFSSIGIYKIKTYSIRKPLFICVLFLLFYQFLYLSFFYKTTTFPFSNTYDILFAKSNRPSQNYWHSSEGKKYILFFEKIFKNSNSKQLIIKKTAEYYNHLEYSDIGNIKIEKNFRLSLKSAFKNYLLFKKPDLLMQSLADKELALLFIKGEKRIKTP